MKPTHSKFNQYCKLTCLGGSEMGECPCHTPNNCELKNYPAFEEARDNAETRFMTHLRNTIANTKVGKVLGIDEDEMH